MTTTRPNAARLIAKHAAGEELPRQLTRDEIRELVEEAAAEAQVGDCSHGVHGPWCREWERMRAVADAAREHLAAWDAARGIDDAELGRRSARTREAMRAALVRDAAPSTIADPDACAWCLDPACSGAPCKHTSGAGTGTHDR